MPTTVADFDRELEETKKKMARLKEGRKAAAAKEREQARKWRTATVSTIGDMVLESLGCGWNEVDLDALKSCLGEWAESNHEDIRFRIITEERTPADAKLALDMFKKARREEKKAAPKPTEQQEDAIAMEDNDQGHVEW